AWAGTLGITMHRMPQIGELGPGVWLASGFGGHGLNTTAMGANLIARAIIDGDQTWRQFTPFELVWAGGIFGRAAAQLRFWVKRLQTTVEERRAKARELAHWQAQLNAPGPAPQRGSGGTSTPETQAASFPDQAGGGTAFESPGESALPETDSAEGTAPSRALSGTTEPAAEPDGLEHADPRAGRRRKRSQASTGRTVEHDAEA